MNDTPNAGAQSITLVFVHGAGSNADFWYEQRAAFAGAHFLNLPGHRRAGQKEAAGLGMRSIQAYADWVARYVESAGLERVVLNGHSMGGAIVQTVALARPRWLAGLVLTGTGARLRVLPELLDLLRTDYPAAVNLIVARSFRATDQPLTYAQKARLNGARRQTLRTPQQVTLGDYEACNAFDLLGKVGEIAVPTLCIVGEQDTMTPPKYSEYLHSHIAGSRLAVVEGAGHMLPMEKPEAYNKALRRFLLEG